MIEFLQEFAKLPVALQIGVFAVTTVLWLASVIGIGLTACTFSDYLAKTFHEEQMRRHELALKKEETARIAQAIRIAELRKCSPSFDEKKDDFFKGTYLDPDWCDEHGIK